MILPIAYSSLPLPSPAISIGVYNRASCFILEKRTTMYLHLSHLHPCLAMSCNHRQPIRHHQAIGLPAFAACLDHKSAGYRKKYTAACRSRHRKAGLCPPADSREGNWSSARQSATQQGMYSKMFEFYGIISIEFFIHESFKIAKETGV